VTEALWAAIPHRASDPALLIVARWPAPVERDLTTESEVAALIGLVGDLRNARATAKLPAGDWLATRVFVPPSLGTTFEALRPALERLARARPLARELTPETLDASRVPGDLTVVAGSGEIEATIRPAAQDDDANALERARLERELADAETWLAAARERLANEAFMAKAPPEVVAGARAREAELAEQVDRLRDRLAG
jgi:valyl-tRNA synthetase